VGNKNAKLFLKVEPEIKNHKFINLCNFLVKFFLNQKIKAEDVKFESYEIQILKNILKKKGFTFKNNLIFSEKFFNNLLREDLKKSREYNIKFILIKAVKHLRQQFVTSKMNEESSNFLKQAKISSNKDFYFYHYYFNEVSKRMNIPIESFYAFKNYTHRYNKNIPKTITKKSLELWKSSSKFISDIENYLRGDFLEDFKLFNIKKINRMTNEWSKKVNNEGLEKSVQSINKYLKSKGCKMPWTLTEVTNALKDTLKVINS